MEEVGLAKGGGRVVGWSRDGAHRAGSPGKGSAKNGHGPDRAPRPLRVSIEIRFPGETVSQRRGFSKYVGRWFRSRCRVVSK